MRGYNHNNRNNRYKLQPLIPFGFYGGKGRLAAQIADFLHYEGVTTYVEMFGGGAAVMLNKAAHDKEIYIEKSISLCCFWRCMADKDLAESVVDRLYDTAFDREIFDSFCDRIDTAEASGQHIDAHKLYDSYLLGCGGGRWHRYALKSYSTVTRQGNKRRAEILWCNYD